MFNESCLCRYFNLCFLTSLIPFIISLYLSLYKNKNQFLYNDFGEVIWTDVFFVTKFLCCGIPFLLFYGHLFIEVL